MKIYMFFVLLLIYMCSFTASQKTSLDTFENIQLLRNFREFLLNTLGETGKKGSREYNYGVKNLRVQQRISGDVPFPCNVTDGRSSEVPTSIHKLKPGDIDIVGALGDSLTAGFGIFSTSLLNIFVENRGASFSIGGQDTWKDVYTLPNFLKEFNPNLFGYALGDSYTHQHASQFNVAEVGAMSKDMPFMTWNLIRRMKADPRVDMKRHWKHITLFIGSNDFCTEICWVPDPWQILKNHKTEMIESLRILRDNLPRTIVSVIPAANLKVLVKMKGRSKICKITVNAECSCLFGLTWRKQREEFFELMKKWQEFDEEVVTYPEFNTQDFTVISQPLSTNITFPSLPNGLTDFRYLSTDCFHFSQTANARTAISLWRNLLEPLNKKSRTWSEEGPFPCPTDDRPYIATSGNS